ncbi:MAG TPA: phosphatase PAP2 family protein [Candidatus Sulfotelmatobacter sp.]|jgi:lipid A 4'-phosphatase|nr:phosphatase PAP2 family protein [Candidatus Sulfotelmatobacter sp.]
MSLDALRRNALTIALAAMLLLVAFPRIDLTVSGWFFNPETGFHLKSFWLFAFILKGMPPILLGLTLAMVLWGFGGDWLRWRFPGLHLLPELKPSSAAFLLASLALGPGLLVNWLLKEHWGRARPSQIVEFGGQAHYTPPVMMADQCVSNCSFSSGHGALGFWVIAFALLAPPRWRPYAVAAALAFGVLVGLTRIVQGGHFLSDTLFSALAVVSLTVFLWRRIVRD